MGATPTRSPWVRAVNEGIKSLLVRWKKAGLPCSATLSPQLVKKTDVQKVERNSQKEEQSAQQEEKNWPVLMDWIEEDAGNRTDSLASVSVEKHGREKKEESWPDAAPSQTPKTVTKEQPQVVRTEPTEQPCMPSIIPVVPIALLTAHGDLVVPTGPHSARAYSFSAAESKCRAGNRHD